MYCKLDENIKKLLFATLRGIGNCKQNQINENFTPADANGVFSRISDFLDKLVDELSPSIYAKNAFKIRDNVYDSNPSGLGYRVDFDKNTICLNYLSDDSDKFVDLSSLEGMTLLKQIISDLNDKSSPVVYLDKHGESFIYVKPENALNGKMSGLYKPRLIDEFKSFDTLSELKYLVGIKTVSV